VPGHPEDLLPIAPDVVKNAWQAIMFAVLGFDLLGDGLRATPDPRVRGHV
jgi:hypothetical protein